MPESRVKDTIRRRYAVVLLVQPGAPSRVPDFLPHVRLVPQGSDRAVVFTYWVEGEAALPQGRAVKARLADWCKEQGFPAVRLALETVLQPVRLRQALAAGDTRREKVGRPVILAYPVDGRFICPDSGGFGR
ncbi:MAG: hypothetical protein M0Z27_00620 [Thermaerobacter sp.]|nr:hypothetical protein [Thermaerobacter sp.]